MVLGGNGKDAGGLRCMRCPVTGMRKLGAGTEVLEYLMCE